MCDALIIEMMLKDKQPCSCEKEKKMTPLPRICIICKEKYGDAFLIEAIHGCVKTVSVYQEMKLDENDVFRNVVKDGETIRVVYKDCDTCAEYDDCELLEVNPDFYTTGYCNRCKKK